MAPGPGRGSGCSSVRALASSSPPDLPRLPGRHDRPVDALPSFDRGGPGSHPPAGHGESGRPGSLPDPPWSADRGAGCRWVGQDAGRWSCPRLGGAGAAWVGPTGPLRQPADASGRPARRPRASARFERECCQAGPAPNVERERWPAAGPVASAEGTRRRAADLPANVEVGHWRRADPRPNVEGFRELRATRAGMTGLLLPTSELLAPTSRLRQPGTGPLRPGGGTGRGGS